MTLGLTSRCAVALSIVCSMSVRADSIERRGTEPPLEGEVTTIDDAGVKLRAATGVEYFVPWDRVRHVEMKHADAALERYQEDATNLWRARTRLERGDATLAGPLFERLFATYRGKTHETALVVAEGLLRCRLARGEHESAVIPALETARLRLKGIKTASYTELPAVIDDKTLLCTTLAPVWASPLAMAKLDRDLAAYDPLSEPVIVSLRLLYRRAVRLQLSMDAGTAEKLASAEHPGVKLLQSIVQMLAKDAAERESARTGLTRDLPGMPVWAQAWVWYVNGISLLLEPGLGRQQIGLVSLVRLPATYADTQPYLAGLALARLAMWYDSNGDAATAAELRSELQSRYSAHPVLASMKPGAAQGTRSNKTGPTEPGKETP